MNIKTDGRHIMQREALGGMLVNQINCKYPSSGQWGTFSYTCMGEDIKELCEWEDGMATHENIYSA